MTNSVETARAICMDLLQSGIDAADPWGAVEKAITLNEKGTLGLQGANGETRFGDWSAIHVLAFGKAAVMMARSALSKLPVDKIIGPTLVITNYENVEAAKSHPHPVDAQLDILPAGHPVPDENGAHAAARLLERLADTKTGELVLILVSGGGSALLPAPAGSMTLQDKITVTEALLESGASINNVNMVRKHLSRIKGGQLAAAAAPADIHSLILSDVIGDDLSSIASGPTVPDPGQFKDCYDILKSHDLLNRIPATAMAHIDSGLKGDIPDTPKADHPCFALADHALIGSNGLSVKAMVSYAKTRNLPVSKPDSPLIGEARDAAENLANWAANWLHSAQSGQSVILTTGGETTVTIRGNGRGGRNQEMALAFATFAEKMELPKSWVFLSGGTDGRDGPTDAAGGIVTPHMLEKMREKTLYPNAMLDNNDSYSALKEVDGLVMTGATGTNVADLQILYLWKD